MDFSRSPYFANAVLWLFLLSIAMMCGLYFGLATPIAFFVAANFAAFALFFVDKNASGSAMGRVPEVVLYVALWFGMIGGLSAMSLVRHKTKKLSFQVVVVIMLLLQVALVLWVVGPQMSSAVFQR